MVQETVVEGSEYDRGIARRDRSATPPPVLDGLSLLDRVLPVANIAAFILGLVLAGILTNLADLVSAGIMKAVDGYGAIAPVIIFLAVAPTVSRFVRMSSGSRVAARVVGWLAGKRLVSLLFAVLFTTVVFKLPFLPARQVHPTAAALDSLRLLGTMLVSSPYFFALYAALAAGFLAQKISVLDRGLAAVADSIEEFSKYLEFVVPFFMLAVGIYIAGLPKQYARGVQLENGQVMTLQPFTTIFGTIPPTQTLLVYVVNGLLVAAVCLSAHGLHLLLTKWLAPEFSPAHYMRHYWIKVYPLLWSTSSESLAVPLNLGLFKRYWPHVREDVRRLVMGLGLQLNLDGTLMCVVVMTGTVSALFGLKISTFELLMSVPMVFLIGYGVPGIPGELILFATPIATILGVPPSMAVSFAGLYIALQFGLPDSFRSGHNSTDGAVACFTVNRWQVDGTPAVRGVEAERGAR